MPNNTAWKTDNYAFVGKAFDMRYAQRINTLAPIMGQRSSNSVDFELVGAGGYGELKPYDGENLNVVGMKRAFKTIIVPKEFSATAVVGYKQAKVDKSGECRKVGSRLGDAAAMTVYMHALRTLGGAFNPSKVGGDGVSWASEKHPVASKGSEGRVYVPDPDAGFYSNVSHDALSVAAITAAQSQANRFVTPDGLPFLCEMDTLLVSPELEAQAKKLCGDDARLDPETAAHGANPVRGLKYIVVGGGTAGFVKNMWAVCDRLQMKDLFNLVYTTKPMVMQHDLDNPLKDPYTAYEDFGIGWGDGRMIIFGNPG
jgi:hypothetical protein